MKIRPHGGFFRRYRIDRLGGCAVAGPWGVHEHESGRCRAVCRDHNAHAPVPQPAPQPAPEVVSGPGVRNTGAYPDLNIPPESAGTPIDATEKDALTRDLSAARDRLAGRAPTGNAERRKRSGCVAWRKRMPTDDSRKSKKSE